jgi:hypothetical protein
MGEEREDYDEAIREINKSGARWLLLEAAVLLIGLGGFVWLMNLAPDYSNVTCNNRPMEPGDTCTVVSRTTTTTRSGQTIPGETAQLTYEEMAEPDLPGSMALWVSTSLVVAGVGLWMGATTIKGWRADLREERRLWGRTDDEEPDASGPVSEQG